MKSVTRLFLIAHCLPNRDDDESWPRCQYVESQSVLSSTRGTLIDYPQAPSWPSYGTLQDHVLLDDLAF